MHCWRFLALFCPLIAILTVPVLWPEGAWAQGTSNPERWWTTQSGNDFLAALVSINGSKVRLQDESGRVSFADMSELSEADRAYISRMSETGLDFRRRSMPRLSNIPQPVKVSGGPEVWETPHFRFHCAGRVTAAFVSQCAPIFEGTLEALTELPMGLDLSPPEGTRFETYFMDQATFSAAVARIMPGRNVAGVYVPAMKRILVPYESLGAEFIGNQVTLRSRGSDPNTLIHEITHQVMHDWLYWIPVWMSEGMAEYVAAIPYDDGRFHFGDSKRGLFERLDGFYGYEEMMNGKQRRMLHPADLITGPLTQWKGSSLEYQSALLMLYYLIHLDGGGQGTALADYIGELRYARTDQESFIYQYSPEYAAVAAKRRKYRQLATEYQLAVASYRKAALAYNERVLIYNGQVRGGVTEEERVSVGPRPSAPTVPAGLKELSGSLEEKTPNVRVNVLDLAQAQARASLLGGRDIDALVKEIEWRYRSLGVQIAFEPRGYYGLGR